MEQIAKPISVVEFKPSTKKNKRYCIKFLMSNGKHIIRHIGNHRYKTYVDTHDKICRNMYWWRNYKNFDAGDITKSGYISAFILWGCSTDIDTNLKIFKNLFNLTE